MTTLRAGDLGVLLASGSLVVALTIWAWGGGRGDTVVIRAAGPALTALGVEGAIADPVLNILEGTTTRAGNDNWETACKDAVTAASSQAGAFPFAAGSKDAAIVVDLPPGTYTIQVSGVANTTGIALVEVVHPAEGGEVENRPARVLGGIAVRPTEPARDDAATGGPPGGERRGDLCRRRRTAHLGAGGGGHPPPRQQLLRHFT